VRQSHIYLAIKENKELYGDPVEQTCSLLGVSRAAYYRWLSGKKCARELENEKIAEIMEQIHTESPDKGYRRIKDDLAHDYKLNVNEKRVLRICRNLDIKSTIKYRNSGCTRQAANPQHIAKNWLNRQFHAHMPNEKWLTDVTEFKWYEGPVVHKVYLSAILDMYDRRIVAYIIRDRNDNPLVFDTLDAAISANPNAHPLFHSDRGFQYTNRVFYNKLKNGKDGTNGNPGAAATFEITGVTALDYGAEPAVTEEAGSTAQARKYALRIPAGKPGTNGSSVTVKSVSESAADGGSNVVEFSDGKTVTIRNGKTGSPGKDGADYVLTEADKAEIVAAVIESLGGNPVFGYVDADNNIIVSGNLPDGSYSVKYEMEDGSTVDIGDLVLDTNVYYSVTNALTNCTNGNSATQAVQGGSYSATISAKSGYELSSVKVTMGGTDISSTAVSGGTISIANVTGNIVITAVADVSGPAYTNRIPLSKDASGNAFNGGQGWKTGYRLGGDGTEKALSDIEVTGFIPIVYGDTIYMKNITDDGTHIMGVYNSSHVKIGTRTFTNIFGGAVSGQVLSMVVNDKWATETSVNSDVAYLRVSATEITADSIITVNEPIV